MAFQLPNCELIWKRSIGIARPPEVASGFKSGIRVHASRSGDFAIISRRNDWELVDFRNGNVIQQHAKPGSMESIFSITEDQRFVAASHSFRNHRVDVWDIASNQYAFPPIELDRGICALSFANADKELRVQTYNAETKFWNMIESKDARKPTKIPRIFFEAIFSPNESHLLGASFEGSAKFFDVILAHALDRLSRILAEQRK